jgi:hypothetical protein
MHWGRRGHRSRARQRLNRRRWSVRRGDRRRSLSSPMSLTSSTSLCLLAARRGGRRSLVRQWRRWFSRRGSGQICGAGTASALQHWRPDHVDEGVCGGVSGLWRLALGKLWRFLVFLQCW